MIPKSGNWLSEKIMPPKEIEPDGDSKKSYPALCVLPYWTAPAPVSTVLSFAVSSLFSMRMGRRGGLTDAREVPARNARP